MKLDFNDLRIKTARVTRIKTRSETNPFYNIQKKKFLPVFTAPMDTVVDRNNINKFLDNRILTIIPRTESVETLNKEFLFKAYSLSDFEKYFLDVKEEIIHINKQDTHYILIDIANGHMKKLHTAIRKAKKIYGNKMIIMAGNIANADTYEILSNAGADYIRLGIGNGNACLTTKQTSIGYPMASLIQECKEVASKIKKPAKIIADGGMKDYSDIIIALALGADFVMVGSLLNKALESCADTFAFKYFKINQYGKLAKWLLKKKFKLTKKFRGMSTKEVQRKLGAKKLKTSEGIKTKQKVEYNLEQWTENFTDYLRSTMSYTNAKNLKEFIGKPEIIRISDKAFQRFNK